jgi:uncharacterized Ntn-hydrolase superfamily protein
VARDPTTGAIGVAAQSHFFGVGSVLAWAEPGYGAVATQAFVNPSFGPRGIDLLRDGMQSEEALSRLLALDEGADLRQIAIIDREGTVGVHTGSRCLRHAGHVHGDQVTAQANMMAADTVWHSMLSAYSAHSGEMPARLLHSLQAAERDGGDVRGRQSACMLIVTGEPVENGGGKLVDLRVDDHPNPLAELERLLKLNGLYGILARLLAEGMFDQPLPSDRLAAAVEELAAAQCVLGNDNQEFNFWRSVILASTGRTSEAMRVLTHASAQNPGWGQLFESVIEAGLIRIDSKDSDQG